jgi:[acyl-carrier-protein] S-malonyltransferase
MHNSAASATSPAVLLFPGQGAQFKGMGQDLAAKYAVARDVFEEVDEAVKLNLSTLMFEGEAATLKLTEITQPALLAHSIAAFRALQASATHLGAGFGFWLVAAGSHCKARVPPFVQFEAGPSFSPIAVMGHSVGEYAAMVAASALDVTGAARLLRLRGLAMKEATRAVRTGGHRVHFAGATLSGGHAMRSFVSF